MLKGNPNVFHYTTFATADKLFAQHPIWQQAKIEGERKFVFEEYVTELKQREVVRLRSFAGLLSILANIVGLITCSKRPGQLALAVSRKLLHSSRNSKWMY